MNWMLSLRNVYDTVYQNTKIAGYEKLLPLYHKRQQVHFLVTITEEGEFVSARLNLSAKNNHKDGAPVQYIIAHDLLPTTARSEVGSTESACHPFTAKIKHIAKDLEKYGKKSYFEVYREELAGWVESEHSHEKPRAVLKYLDNHDIVADLVSSGLVFLDAKGNITDPDASIKDEITGVNIKKSMPPKGAQECLVGWEVISADSSVVSKACDDASLVDAWQKYYREKELADNGTGICHLTGEDVVLAKKHPSGVLPGKPSSRIYCAKEKPGFRFSGRMPDTNQTLSDGMKGFAVGRELSMKAHYALAWLIQNQRAYHSSDTNHEATVFWIDDGVENPSIAEHGEAPLSGERFEFSFDDFAVDDGAEAIHSIGDKLAKNLQKSIAGFGDISDENLESKELRVMTVRAFGDKAAHMAVTRYEFMNIKEYLSRISKWYQDFAVSYTYKGRVVIKAPTPFDIFNAFKKDGDGKDSDMLHVRANVQDAILGKTNIERTLVDNIVYRLHNCESYADENDWSHCLRTAAGLIRGYHLRNAQQKEYTMSLDSTYNSRDYLFGRLLAVADSIEEYAHKHDDVHRQTNAKRYLQNLIVRPAVTWSELNNKLLPYREKLHKECPSFLKKRERIEREIMDLMSIEDFNSTKPLGHEWVLGYHHQMQSFFTKSHDAEDVNTASDLDDEKDSAI